jgi:hypothetical protein
LEYHCESGSTTLNGIGANDNLFLPLIVELALPMPHLELFLIGVLRELHHRAMILVLDVANDNKKVARNSLFFALFRSLRQ